MRLTSLNNSHAPTEPLLHIELGAPGLVKLGVVRRTKRHAVVQSSRVGLVDICYPWVPVFRPSGEVRVTEPEESLRF